MERSWSQSISRTFTNGQSFTLRKEIESYWSTSNLWQWALHIENRCGEHVFTTTTDIEAQTTSPRESPCCLPGDQVKTDDGTQMCRAGGWLFAEGEGPMHCQLL